MTTFDEAYFYGLVYTAVVFLVFAIFSLVWLCLFLCIRCCTCSCCPDCCIRLSYCCCGGEPTKFSLQKKRIYQTVALVFAIMIIIAVGIGFGGNSNITKGFDHFTGTLLDTVTHIYDTASYCYQQITQLKNGDPSLTDSFQQFRDAVATVRDEGKQVRDFVVQVDGYRAAVIGVGFVIPLICLLIGGLGVCLKKRQLQYIFTFILGIDIFFLWLSLAVHQPAQTVASDGCDEASYYLDHPNELYDNEFLVSCIQNSTYFAQFQDITSVIQSTLTEIKQEAKDGYGIDISDAVPPANATVEQSVINMVSFVNSQLTIVIQNLPYPDNETSQIADYISDTQVFLSIALNVSDLATCGYLKTLMLSVKDSLCNEVVGGAREIVVANWILIIFCVLVAYCLFTLFNEQKPQEYEQFHEDQQVALPLDADKTSTTDYFPIGQSSSYSQKQPSSPSHQGATTAQQITTDAEEEETR